jgi:hypothetical protein
LENLAAKLEDTNSGTKVKNEKSRQNDGSENADNKEINGGADGTRTRDLQRDRLAF